MTIQKILEAINNNDIEALKNFKKELDVLDFENCQINLKELASFLIVEASKTEDEKLKVAITSLITWKITMYFADKLTNEYEEFIFKNIVHNNGNIRQQAVKMGSMFIKSITDKNDKLTKKFILDFVKKLLDLINKYEVLNKIEIEKVKPCQYKSLMLLLEELSFNVKEGNKYLYQDIENKLDSFYDLYDDYFFDPSYTYRDREKKEDYYYDAMEYLNSGEWQIALKILNKGILEYENYIELYVGLASAYRFNRDIKNFERVVETGFKKLKEKFPTWPKELEWGYINNRQFLRMIDFKASLYFEQGEKNKAEAMYKLLLKLNPRDNQGIRYYLAGLYEGISSFEVDEMFNEANKSQDHNKVENLFNRENKKHNFFIFAEDDDCLDEEDYGDKNDLLVNEDKDNKDSFIWNIR